MTQEVDPFSLSHHVRDLEMRARYLPDKEQRLIELEEELQELRLTIEACRDADMKLKALKRFMNSLEEFPELAPGDLEENVDAERDQTLGSDPDQVTFVDPVVIPSPALPGTPVDPVQPEHPDVEPVQGPAQDVPSNPEAPEIPGESEPQPVQLQSQSTAEVAVAEPEAHETTVEEPSTLIPEGSQVVWDQAVGESTSVVAVLAPNLEVLQVVHDVKPVSGEAVAAVREALNQPEPEAKLIQAPDDVEFRSFVSLVQYILTDNPSRKFRVQDVTEILIGWKRKPANTSSILSGLVSNGKAHRSYDGDVALYSAKPPVNPSFNGLHRAMEPSPEESASAIEKVIRARSGEQLSAAQLLQFGQDELAGMKAVHVNQAIMNLQARGIIAIHNKDKEPLYSLKPLRTHSVDTRTFNALEKAVVKTMRDRRQKHTMVGLKSQLIAQGHSVRMHELEDALENLVVLEVLQVTSGTLPNYELGPQEKIVHLESK